MAWPPFFIMGKKLQVSIREKISISGKSKDQRVAFQRRGLDTLYMVPSPRVAGEWFWRFGCAHMRYLAAQWLREEFNTEKPRFEEVFERVKSLTPPPPPNPKAMPWLK